MDIYPDEVFNTIIKLSRNRQYFQTKKGEFLELPIFKWNQQSLTFSLKEQILIYNTLMSVINTSSNKISNSTWKNMLRKIDTINLIDIDAEQQLLFILREIMTENMDNT